MKNNYIRILIIPLVLSSFTIADEMEFVNDLKKIFKQISPNIDFFPEEGNYCGSRFFTCNDKKKITAIEFKDVNVDGIYLPYSISGLTDLVSLYISNSKISIDRYFMDNLYRLKNSLKIVRIINTKFETSLRLEGLNLVHLEISYNDIKQNLDSISFSKTLKYIDLSHNNFYGDIKIFNNIPDLEILYLSFNNLTGNIPSFSNNIKLMHLDLSNNNLSGNIPDFSKNRNMRTLNVAYNNLSGDLPSFNNNRALCLLYLHNNRGFTYNCPDFKNLINVQDNQMKYCNLGKIVFSKGCWITDTYFDKCELRAVLSNAKSLYYISIVQLLAMPLVLFFI